MADLLHITTPVAPKNYNLTSRPIVQNDAVFDLVDLSKVIKTADRSDQSESKQDAAFRDTVNLPKTSVSVSKDPTASAKMLRGLLGGELSSKLTEAGNVQLLNKLTELANEVVLTQDSLVSDMALQDKSATIFNGDFFSLVRTIADSTGNAELKAAILGLLKATANAASSQDILNSLAANLKFLAEELAPSTTLSGRLMKLSEMLLSPDAAENFAQLQGQILSAMHEVNGSLLLTDNLKNFLPLITHSLSRYHNNPNELADSFGALLGQITNGELRDALSSAFADYIRGAGFLSGGQKLSLLSGDAQLLREQEMLSLAEQLGQAANEAANGLSGVALGDKLSHAGNLHDILMSVLPRENEAMLSSLLDDFSQTKNLDSLLNRLSVILNSIDSMEAKIPLAQSMNHALTSLAREAGITYTPPTSMENLANFLSKNINDNALKSLNFFNQGAMIQSMLTAPGIFTPLSHYLIPLKWGSSRAFGELWVDKDAERSADGGDEATHLFLSFEIEAVGDFELELYAKKTDLNVALLCPPEFAKSFSGIRDSISRIAASKGYTARNTTVDALRAKRNLVDVFSKLKERRVGLNVTA